MSPYGIIPNALTAHLLILQSRDAWCRKREWEVHPEGVILKGPFRGRWCVDHAGLMRRDGLAYVPYDLATRMEILRANHDDPWTGGHFGISRTMSVIQKQFWWPQMQHEIRTYVADCDTCQRIKVPRHKLYGLLSPLPQPDRPWQDISMDFITGLPPSARRRKAYDAILVVVCRYSKMVQYLPCTKDTNAPELADRLIKGVFCKFGSPRSIISDRDSLFTSAFWSIFCYYA
jgi:hypothetical protein